MFAAILVLRIAGLFCHRSPARKPFPESSKPASTIFHPRQSSREGQSGVALARRDKAGLPSVDC